ncbi:MAG: PQQ-binding-like beta-propeller repeat protein [Hellea sp.]|nr:PQQ-binding-like beta-propeller repeat protein [Hellea sp.]
MKFEPQWQRDLHFALNPKSMIIDGKSIFITERRKKLSKIDMVSGETVWSRNITDAYGWATTSNGKLFYMSSGDGLCVLEQDTGERISEFKFQFPYLGYVKVWGNTILTGGWRGYTDLCAYDLETSKLLWSHNTKTADLQKFSVPSFLNKNRIFTVNHTTKRIEIIDVKSGKLLDKNVLPDGVHNIDLGCSYQIVDKDVTFLTNRGKLFKFSTEDLSLAIEELPLESVQTNIPCYFADEMIIRDTEQTYCLLNRAQKEIVWQIPIEHNSWTDVISVKLGNDHFVIAGAQGAMKVISRAGEVSRLSSENRITTPFLFIDGYLIYGTKGSIKCFKYLE